MHVHEEPRLDVLGCEPSKVNLVEAAIVSGSDERPGGIRLLLQGSELITHTTLLGLPILHNLTTQARTNTAKSILISPELRYNPPPR